MVVDAYIAKRIVLVDDLRSFTGGRDGFLDLTGGP